MIGCILILVFYYLEFQLIMEVKKISPPVTGYLHVKLDQDNIDYLWKIIDIAKTKNINIKNTLIGNISQSLMLQDIDSFFFKSVCVPLVKFYRENNFNCDDPVEKNTLLKPESALVLDSFWVNHQYKNEFNPYHDHSGVYSFAIWMKIPYDWQDQKKLPQYNEMPDKNIKAGCFEFEYIDSLGGVKNLIYKLSPMLEGNMVFFPARLRHCVYPFFNTDKPRISISGNLSYLPS